jgi:ribosomal protein S18 acetylase RimI-like enzyme
MGLDQRVQLEKVSEEDILWLTEVAKNAYDLEGAPKLGAPRGIIRIKQHTKFIDYWDYYKIRFDNFTAGGIMVAPRGDEHCELISIYIDPEYQRKAIGTTTVQKSMEMYSAKIWTLGVYPEDEVSIEFFKSNNFIVVGHMFDESLRTINWMERKLKDFSGSKISELKEGQGEVFVEGRITEKAYARGVRGRIPGQSLSVANAGFEDETGRIILTLWNEQIKLLQEGEWCRVENGYIRSYRGVKQLSSGKSGRLIKLLK